MAADPRSYLHILGRYPFSVRSLPAYARETATIFLVCAPQTRKEAVQLGRTLGEGNSLVPRRKILAVVAPPLCGRCDLVSGSLCSGGSGALAEKLGQPVDRRSSALFLGDQDAAEDGVRVGAGFALVAALRLAGHYLRPDHPFGVASRRGPKQTSAAPAACESCSGCLLMRTLFAAGASSAFGDEARQPADLVDVRPGKPTALHHHRSCIASDHAVQ